LSDIKGLFGIVTAGLGARDVGSIRGNTGDSEGSGLVGTLVIGVDVGDVESSNPMFWPAPVRAFDS
jgi:hypothetical protein